MFRTILNFFRRWWKPKASVGAAAAQASDKDIVFSLAHSRIPTADQLKFLPDVLQPVERNIVRSLATIASFAFIFLIGHFLAVHIQPVAKAGGTLTEGVIGVPQHINPVLARPNTADMELAALTFRGLMTVNPKLELVPDLAEKVEVSDDGKTYTIRLRNNLRWSDQQALTSRDVQFTFDTIADEDYKSPYASVFQSVSTEAPDSRTIIFRLEQPLAPFLSYLTLGLLPAHAWENATPQNFTLDEFNLKPIGNGPYRFASFAKDRNGSIHSYTFERNPYFHGQKPYIEKLVIKLYDDQEQALEALRKNSIDSFGSIPVSARAELARKYALQEFSLAQLISVFFNQRTNPALKAKEVRQALAAATNREDLITQALQSSGRPIHSPLVPGLTGYHAGIKQHPFSLETANKILEDAGWKRNDKGIRQKGPQLVTFTMTSPDEPVYVAIAEHLAKNWREIGAQVELKKIASSRMQKEIIRPRQYEVLIFGQIYGADPDPFPFWHSTQQRETGFNLSIFFNRKMDQDLETGRSTTDTNKRKEAYVDFQNMFADELPAIPLFQNEFVYAHHKNLRGFASDQLIHATDRYRQIDRWYVRTKLRWQND